MKRNYQLPPNTALVASYLFLTALINLFFCPIERGGLCRIFRIVATSHHQDDWFIKAEVSRCPYLNFYRPVFRRVLASVILLWGFQLL